MKAKTQVTIGLIAACLVITIIIYCSFARGLSDGSDFDGLFLAVYAYALKTKKLVVAKWMGLLYLFPTALTSYAFTMDTLNSPKVHPFSVYLFTEIILWLFVAMVWVGIRGLSQITKSENGIVKSKLIPLVIDADTKVHIGLITAIVFILSRFVYNFDFGIVFLAIYVFALLKKYPKIAGGMFFFWLALQAMGLSRLISDFSALHRELIRNHVAVTFVVVYGIFLWVGVRGIEQVRE